MRLVIHSSNGDVGCLIAGFDKFWGFIQPRRDDGIDIQRHFSPWITGATIRGSITGIPARTRIAGPTISVVWIPEASVGFPVAPISISAGTIGAV